MSKLLDAIKAIIRRKLLEIKNSHLNCNFMGIINTWDTTEESINWEKRGGNHQEA